MLEGKYLTPDEWATFEELFDKSQGTTYYDCLELALDIARKVNPELADKFREEKEKLATILFVTVIAMGKKA